MIEMIYKEENQGEEIKNQEITLRIPKNIRQIGSIHGSRKIYVEDYVITYLQQFSIGQAPKQQVMILLGRTHWLDDKQYIFISGAIHAQNATIEMENIVFSEECWMRIYGQMKKYFDRLEIMGWFLSSFENPFLISDAMVYAHVNNFPGNDKVFMILDPQERDDAFYHYENGQLKKEDGYYIYYEKNREMQEYIIQHREQPLDQPKAEVEDEATRQFREMMNAKKEKQQEKQTMTFLYAASTVMVLVFMLIGITMINNYDKMLNMESSIAAISNVVDKKDEQFKEQETQDQQTEKTEQTEKTKESKESKESKETKEVQETQVPVESVDGKVERQNLISSVEAQKQADIESSNSKEESKDDAKDNDSASEKVEKEEANQTKEASAKVAQEYHVVSKGETLQDISIQYYGTTNMVDSLCSQNGIKNSNQIFPGQKIILPQK